MLEDQDIICVSATLWSQNWLSNHQYMSRLARRNRVLYVEKPLNLVSFLKANKRRFAKAQFQRMLQGKIERIDDSLFVGTPPAILPLRYEWPFIHINQWLLGRWIHKAKEELGFERPILWTYAPDAALLYRRLDESLRVYSITDDHASYQGTRNRENSIRKWERRLIEGSDIVFATAQNLADMKRQYNPETFFTPHGVDAKHFATALARNCPEPDDLKSLRRPILGFVGLLNCRIDIELISKIATCRPDWTLLFLGPLEPEFDPDAFSNLPNVHLMGRRDKQTLPCYLKCISVGIIPYVLDKHTNYLHPLKALEYLAAGKPVVSTSLPALAAYQPHVCLTKTTDDFIHAVQRALASDSPEKQAERSEFAQQYTWDRQLDRMSDLILPHIDVSHSPPAG